ncbi:MAG: hypothetical protein ACTSYM_11100 [Candidatus Baldrarchaeia archaeon]
MLEKVLRRHKFLPVRRNGQILYFRHSIAIGGIYVAIKGRIAEVKIPEINFSYTFNAASRLEKFLKALERNVEDGSVMPLLAA